MFKVVVLLLSLFFSIHASPIKKETPVALLGEGIAGMTAALQLSQAGFHPLVILGPMPGGIITVSPNVENWPGDISISGADLADRFEDQLEKRGIEFLAGIVTDINFSKRPFVIHVNNPLIPNESFAIEAQCCIVALGATPNLLQVPGEETLLYKKIFTCAPCDGARFKNQSVVVVGGGDSALVEAHYLSNIAKQVVIIVRGSQFKTVQPAFKETVLSKPNVKVLYQTIVEKLEDSSGGVKLKLKKGNLADTLLVQGVFLAIGSRPNTQLFKNSLDLDEEGYIVLKKGQETSTAGVFAAGDISDRIYKQAITAAGDATKAALQAIQFLSKSSYSLLISKATSTQVEEMTDFKTLQSTIATSNQPVIAYFYSSSCLPCRFFKSTYLRWSNDYKDVASFVKINSSTCPACFEAYHIQGLPTVLIFDDDGQLIRRISGISHMADVRLFLESLR